MSLKPKRKTRFVTNLYPNSKVDIGGASEVVIQKINEHGQVEVLIITDYDNPIDIYKIKDISKQPKKEISGNF
jgi:hypothetical protein